MTPSTNRAICCPDEADVVVVGGGPAGIAAALALNKHGCQVVVVEKSWYEAVRIGETFPPVINRILAKIGFLDDVESGGHLPSNGIRSHWGKVEPFERSFIFDPHGTGWHVNRQEFDAALSQFAQSEGITVALGTELQTFRRSENGRWRLIVASGQDKFRLQSDFLVDATGRASLVARHLGHRRQQIDRLVGIVGYYDCVDQPATVEAFTLIETTADGWWYSAPLPGRRLVVALMTDADLCAKATLTENSSWREKLKLAFSTYARSGSFNLARPVQIVAANTSHLDRFYGDGWLAVGDAAFAFDPLSGDGVYRALQSGSQGGQAIVAASSGVANAFDGYAKEQSEMFSHYKRQQEMFYARERRWPESAFWKRRSPQASVSEVV